jgi:hypothetical protein
VVKSRAPELITLVPDESHTRHVGCTDDGRQFFLTAPFRPALGADPGREYLALYLFDQNGHLLGAWIKDLGTRAELDLEAARGLRTYWLGELGRVRFRPIRVRPFQVERFGTPFGLIPEPPEDEEDHWWVTAQPGDYLAFTPPWDGRYDT